MIIEARLFFSIYPYTQLMVYFGLFWALYLSLKNQNHAFFSRPKNQFLQFYARFGTCKVEHAQGLTPKESSPAEEFRCDLIRLNLVNFFKRKCGLCKEGYFYNKTYIQSFPTMR